MRNILSCLLCILIWGCSDVSNQNNKKSVDSSKLAKPGNPVSLTNDSNRQSYFYDPSISTISGRVCKIPVIDPNIGDDDSRVPNNKMIAVVLQKRISVVNPPDVDTTKFDEDNPGDENEYDVDTIQLALTSLHGINKFLGHIVQLKGAFYHADNGNQFTNVLMKVNEIKLGSDSILFNWRNP
jgi:hypothetical protein